MVDISTDAFLDLISENNFGSLSQTWDNGFLLTSNGENRSWLVIVEEYRMGYKKHRKSSPFLKGFIVSRSPIALLFCAVWDTVSLQRRILPCRILYFVLNRNKTKNQPWVSHLVKFGGEKNEGEERRNRRERGEEKKGERKIPGNRTRKSLQIGRAVACFKFSSFSQRYKKSLCSCIFFLFFSGELNYNTVRLHDIPSSKSCFSFLSFFFFQKINSWSTSHIQTKQPPPTNDDFSIKVMF